MSTSNAVAAAMRFFTIRHSAVSPIEPHQLPMRRITNGMRAWNRPSLPFEGNPCANSSDPTVPFLAKLQQAKARMLSLEQGRWTDITSP
jgi:hypothetical protein